MSGREGRDGEEQAEVQVGRIDVVAEKQTGKVAQQDTCEIVEIKAADTPVVFEHLAELIIAEQTDDGKEEIAA